jgi:hypothetical protein
MKSGNANGRYGKERPEIKIPAKKIVKTNVGKVLRDLPKISTTYCVLKVAEYNSNPCGICTPVVLSLTSVHQLSERPSHTC